MQDQVFNEQESGNVFNTPPPSPPPATSTGAYTFDDAGLARLRAEHPEYGSIIDGLLGYGYNARDVMGNVLGPNQQPRPLDQIPLPASTNGAQTAQLGYGQTANARSGGGSDFSIDPAYLAPWTEAFQGVPGLPTLNAPAPYVPGTFEAPGADSIYADPGYRFRVGEGIKALQNSAAGKGILRTGGTLKDITNYGQAAATQEYPNVFGRALTAFQTNEGNAANAYATNYGVTKDVNASKVTANQSDYDRALEDYKTRFSIFKSNQDSPFAKSLSLAQLGAGVAA